MSTQAFDLLRCPAEPRVDAVELTVLIPCLNEAETLATCVTKARAYLSRAGIAGEVLVSDNGSTDGSIEIARAHGARVVHAPIAGYGGALRCGIEAARGRFVIIGDADDSYDFSDLSAFVASLRDGADLVMGNRFRGGIAAGAMPPLHRYLGNPVLSWLGRLLFRTPVGDFHCGLRGFDRAAIVGLGLRTTGMEFASEMVVAASLHGLRIGEVPTGLAKDGRSRPPHLRTWRDGWRHLRFLLVHSPRWATVYPGAMVMGLGLALMAMLAGGPVTLAGFALDKGVFTLACILAVMGLQGVTFGLIARRFAAANDLLPTRPRKRRLLDAISMERLLQGAGLLLVLGGGGLLWSVRQGVADDGLIWRAAMLSGSALVAAAQFALAAFLLGVLDLHPGDARARQARLSAAFPG